MATPAKISDALTITQDGRAVVDVQKLLQSERVKAAIEAMRKKTKIVSRRRAGESASGRPAQRG